MKYFTSILSLCLSLSIWNVNGQNIPHDAESIKAGKVLFNDNCFECHSVGNQVMGPSLASIEDKRPIDWLMPFIKNSQKVISEGDPYAVHLYEQYNDMVMPDFQDLSDEDVLNILAYLHDSSQDKHHDYSADSAQYYDEEILSKALSRSVKKDPGEINYFEMPDTVHLKNDLETIQVGGDLYKAHCQSCHELNERKTGPALASVTDRLPGTWLLSFINSPKKMFESGDDYANFVASNYPLVMPDFNDVLPEEKILSILSYIRYESGAQPNVAGANANAVLKQNDTLTKAMDDDISEKGYTDKKEATGFKIAMIFVSAATIIIVILVLIKVFKGLSRKKNKE